MISDECQGVVVRMGSPRTSPAPLYFKQPFVLELLYRVGHIFTGDTIFDELRMGDDQLPIVEGAMGSVLHKQTKKRFRCIAAKSPEGIRRHQLDS